MGSTVTDRITGLSTSVAVKVPVEATTTGNITLAGLGVQAGGTWNTELSAGDRILVKNQSDAKENGIYTVFTSDWRRAKDFDGYRDVVKGTAVALADSGDRYLVSTENPIVIGSSEISFVPHPDDFRVMFVGSVAESVQDLDESALSDGQEISVKGWHSGTERGGGRFFWSSTTAKANHNGINVISLTVPKVSAQAGTTDAERRDNFLAGAGETDGAGIGCLVRETEGQLSIFVAGAYGSGVVGQEDTGASNAMKALFLGQIIAFPKGVYRGNFLFDNNTRLMGAGQNATTFVVDDPAVPVITFRDDSAIEQYYTNGSGFLIDGEDSALVGIRVGDPAQTTQANYCVYEDIEVKRCEDNIELNRAIGVYMRGVYSHTATGSALLIPTNDIVTTARFVACQFRQSFTNVELRGGAILNFDTCVIESALNTGLLIQKDTTSGARQITFNQCWLENNGYAPTTSTSGGLFISMATALASAEHPSYLKFNSCVIASAGTEPDLRLVRGNNIEFDQCSFRALDSNRLVVSTAAGYAYAMLKNCGTIDESPSPTLYANFPDRVLGGNGQYLGIAYEYQYEGHTFRNFSGKLDRQSASISNYDVTGVSVLRLDTVSGNITVTSLSGGFDGQEIKIIKPSAANSLVITHGGAGDQPIYVPDAVNRTLTGRSGASLVCEGGVWYFTST